MNQWSNLSQKYTLCSETHEKARWKYGTHQPVFSFSFGFAFKSANSGTKWIGFHLICDCVCAFPIIFFDWWCVFILFSIFKLGSLVAITISTFAHWLAEHLHRPIPLLLNLYWHCPILCYAPGGALGIHLNQPFLWSKKILFKAT